MRALNCVELFSNDKCRGEADIRGVKASLSEVAILNARPQGASIKFKKVSRSNILKIFLKKNIPCTRVLGARFFFSKNNNIFYKCVVNEHG